MLLLLGLTPARRCGSLQRSLDSLVGCGGREDRKGKEEKGGLNIVEREEREGREPITTCNR